MGKGGPKIFVLSLDGVSHGQFRQVLDLGWMPALAKLMDGAGAAQTMETTLPAVSSSAWASYATGLNPGGHGIYGFVDRTPDGRMYLPNRLHRTGDDVWEILSAAGRRAFGMNVPSIYPPRPVNGVVISGFLCPELSSAAWPAAEARYLAGIGYRIDIDVVLCRKSPQCVLGQVLGAIDGRRRAMIHYLEQGSWDYFHVHVMEIDRLNHFRMRAFAEDAQGCDDYRQTFAAIDGLVTDLAVRIGDETTLVLLSDHGMCPVEYEMNLGRWLVEAGWCVAGDGELGFEAAKTTAFSLIPGRVYLNLAGRECDGRVTDEQFGPLRDRLATELGQLRGPNGQSACAAWLTREQAYGPEGTAGSNGSWQRGPDLIGVPRRGMDIKVSPRAAMVFGRTDLQGMHTHDDAFLWIRGGGNWRHLNRIEQIVPWVLGHLGVE